METTYRFSHCTHLLYRLQIHCLNSPLLAPSLQVDQEFIYILRDAEQCIVRDSLVDRMHVLSLIEMNPNPAIVSLALRCTYDSYASPLSTVEKLVLFLLTYSNWIGVDITLFGDLLDHDQPHIPTLQEMCRVVDKRVALP